MDAVQVVFAILTILIAASGAFGTLLNAWVNYRRYVEEKPKVVVEPDAGADSKISHQLAAVDALLADVERIRQSVRIAATRGAWHAMIIGAGTFVFIVLVAIYAALFAAPNPALPNPWATYLMLAVMASVVSAASIQWVRHGEASTVAYREAANAHLAERVAVLSPTEVGELFTRILAGHGTISPDDVRGAILPILENLPHARERKSFLKRKTSTT